MCHPTNDPHPPAAPCRIQQLQGCFATAIDVYKYAGLYRGVFPVKCNHDRELLKGMIVSGSPHGFGGLEVGSQLSRVVKLSHACSCRQQHYGCRGSGWVMPVVDSNKPWPVMVNQHQSPAHGHTLCRWAPRRS